MGECEKVLRIRGLPWTATAEEIIEWFGSK